MRGIGAESQGPGGDLGLGHAFPPKTRMRVLWGREGSGAGDSSHPLLNFVPPVLHAPVAQFSAYYCYLPPNMIDC